MAIWEIGGGKGDFFSMWRYIHSLKWGFGVDVEGD
jgi:hypothetical protein